MATIVETHPDGSPKLVHGTFEEMGFLFGADLEAARLAAQTQVVTTTTGRVTAPPAPPETPKLATEPTPQSTLQPQPTPQPPGLLTKAASFAGAVVRHVAAGSPKASPAVQKERLAICRSNQCGHHRFEPGGELCAACGCSGRNLLMKLSWADQRCPLDPPKWGPVAPADQIGDQQSAELAAGPATEATNGPPGEPPGDPPNGSATAIGD